MIKQMSENKIREKKTGNAIVLAKLIRVRSLQRTQKKAQTKINLAKFLGLNECDSTHTQRVHH